MIDGLVRNQHNISIFFKIDVLSIKKLTVISILLFYTPLNIFFAKQKCNVCNQTHYLCLRMKEGSCGHCGVVIQSVG